MILLHAFKQFPILLICLFDFSHFDDVKPPFMCLFLLSDVFFSFSNDSSGWDPSLSTSDLFYFFSRKALSGEKVNHVSRYYLNLSNIKHT